MWVAFANAKATHIFSAKILAYMPYLMTYLIVSFEQLGPDYQLKSNKVTRFDRSILSLYTKPSLYIQKANQQLTRYLTDK